MTMTSVLGHLNEMEFSDKQLSNWSSCDPEILFSARISTFVKNDNKDVASNIENESRSAQKLFIWTDNDREGEHIGYEVVQIAQKGNPSLTGENVKRAVFNNIEAGHVRQAARFPQNLDMRLVNAVQARMEVDLRIGAALTRFQTMSIQRSISSLQNKVISYGSCQFPTLGFIVDQYKRVTNFKSEPFWYIAIEAKMPQSFVLYQHQQQNLQNDQEDSASSTEKRKSRQKKPKDTLAFKWNRNHLFDRAMTHTIFEVCLDSGKKPKVSRVIEKPASLWRPLPLTTVELQKVCSSKFRGMSAKQVLDIAERLYNKGFISYPRTETDVFDDSINLESLVRKQYISHEWGTYAKTLLGENGGNTPKFVTPRKGKHNDKAHPPIHPVVHANRSAMDKADDWKVYEFITRRFLACCSADAKGARTSVTLNWNDELFTASGLVVLERNFLEVYPYQKWESSAVQIPQGMFNVGNIVELSSANMLEGETTAPKHLTEPDLISLMDANGIGTDATMADHIDTIIQREYVLKRKATDQSIPIFVPTALGYGLVEGYDKIGFDSSLSKPFLRKEMELSMKAIGEGQKSKEEVLRDTIEQYQEVYLIAKRQVNTLLRVTKEYMNSAAAATTTGTTATTSTSAGNNTANDNNADPLDFQRPSTTRGARRGGARSASRGRGRGRGRSTSGEMIAE